MGYLVPPYTSLDLVLGSGTPVFKILVRALGRSSSYYFKVLNLFYSLLRGPNGFITEKTILFQGPRGGPTFSRGSNFFQGGPNANFYRNPYRRVAEIQIFEKTYLIVIKDEIGLKFKMNDSTLFLIGSYAQKLVASY